MEGFKKTPKIACFKEGGQVKYESRKEHKEEEKADVAQDKAMIKKGVAQHESKLHKGEPKTELKLKTGGRAKKEKGTVRKYCGGKSVKKMADGSIVDRLKDNIMGTEAQNEAAKKGLDKIAAQPGVLGTIERTIRGKVNAGPYKPSKDDKYVQNMPDKTGSISDTDARKFIQNMPYKPGQGSSTDFEQKTIGRKKGGKC